ncbi:hypothetical protein K3495_g15878, partial [Podosphaera aphanis]
MFALPARDVYLDATLNKFDMSFEQRCEYMKNHFETEPWRIRRENIWNGMDLPLLLRQHPERNLSETFEWLNAETRRVQRGLPNHQGDFALRQRIISACYGCPELRPVLLEPPPDAEGVCNKIRAQIAQLEFTSPTSSYIQTVPVSTTAHMVDRHYKKANNNNRFQIRNNRNNFKRNDFKSSKNWSKRCLVCTKPECWSTNHSPEERQKAYDRIKKKFPLKNDAAVQQFIIDFEGLTGEDEFDAMLAECEAEFDKNEDSEDFWPGEELGFVGLVEEIGGEKSVAYFNDQTVKHMFTTPRISSSTLDDEKSQSKDPIFIVCNDEIENLSNFEVLDLPHVAIEMIHTFGEVSTL